MLKRRIFLLKEIKNLKKKRIPMNIEDLEMKLKDLDEEITNYSVNRKSKKISKHIEEISDPSNKFDNNKMWKLRKKLCPKVLEIPSAKLNEKGILITEKSQLKNLYKKTYIKP